MYKTTSSPPHLSSTDKTFTALPAISFAQRFKKVSHLGLDDVGVDLSDSVDGVRSHDAQVRHVHPLAPLLLDQGHLPQLVHVLWVESYDFLQRQKHRGSGSARPDSRCRCVLVSRDSYVEVALVDLVDDLQVSRQQGLQQVHGPALQSFGQDGVVGVGEGAPGQVPGLPEEKHRVTRDDFIEVYKSKSALSRKLHHRRCVTNCLCLWSSTPLCNTDICFALVKICGCNFLCFVHKKNPISSFKPGAALSPSHSALTHRVPVELLDVHKDPHQLGDGHGRVGVVQLDGNLRTRRF